MSLTILPQLKKQIAPVIMKNRNSVAGFDEKLEKKRICTHMDLFFESKALGIQALPAKDRTLKEALLSYQKWTEFMRVLWRSQEHHDRMRDFIFVIGSRLYDRDETLLSDKSNIPAIDQKMACWAAVTVFLEQSIAEAVDFLECNNLDIDQVVRNGFASDTKFKSFMDIHGPDHIATLMILVILLGRLDDINAVYEFMYQSVPIFGMDDDMFQRQKKNSQASKLCSHILNDYFSATFKKILNQHMVSSNFIIDVVFNDAVKEFIINL